MEGSPIRQCRQPIPISQGCDPFISCRRDGAGDRNLEGRGACVRSEASCYNYGRDEN